MSFKQVSEFESIDQLKKYTEDRKNNRFKSWKNDVLSYTLVVMFAVILIFIPCIFIGLKLQKEECSRLDWFEEKSNYTFHNCTQKQIDHDDTKKYSHIMFIPFYLIALWVVLSCMSIPICIILDCLDDRKLKKKLAQFNELKMQA